MFLELSIADIISPVFSDYGFDSYTNAINLEREYYQVFSCEFNLLYYPFDTQVRILVIQEYLGTIHKLRNPYLDSLDLLLPL